MELTLLVLIITIIVSIRRSAWYQRYKVRGAARVVSEARHRWCFVNKDGVAFYCRDKPFLLDSSGTIMAPHANQHAMFGYYPALRNQVFQK